MSETMKIPKKTWPSDDLEPVHDLCRAILTQAFQDFNTCLNRCNQKAEAFHDNMRARALRVAELEAFFRSEWFSSLLNEAYCTSRGDTLAYNILTALHKKYDKCAFKKQLEAYEKKNGKIIYGGKRKW